MGETVIAAVITGALSLAGVVITCLLTARKNENIIRVSQAVTDTKLETLTREVRMHNHFAQRMPVVEEQIKGIHQRLNNLEQTESGG